MTRNVQAAADALDDEIVNVEYFGKLRRHRLKAVLKFGVADNFLRLFNRRRLALDVGENVGFFRDVATHVGFEFSDLIVRALERHALVEFDVLLHVQAAGKILDADVVHIEILVGGHGSDPVEDVLRTLRARNRLHGHVGVGQDAVDGFRHRGSQLARALEGHGARQSYGEIREIAVPGFAYTDAIDFENAIDAQDRVVNLGSHTRRRGV